MKKGKVASTVQAARNPIKTRYDWRSFDSVSNPMAAATPRAMRDVTIFNEEATTFNRFWSYRSAEIMKVRLTFAR
jgi:hypothetical protein